MFGLLMGMLALVVIIFVLLQPFLGALVSALIALMAGASVYMRVITRR